MIDIYDPKLLDVQTSLGPLVGKVRMVVLKGVEQEFLLDKDLAALEITGAQFVILANLVKGEAKSACELCRALEYDRGAMSRMIDRLEKKKLLRRVALAHTRREQSLEVTAAGKAAFPAPRCPRAYAPRTVARGDGGGKGSVSEDAGLSGKGAESVVERRHQGPGARSGANLESNAGEQLAFFWIDSCPGICC